MKKICYLILCILMIVPAYALTTAEEGNSGDITLVDVTADGQSCIFNVYGKTVVVDRRDKATVDGVTIYVQEVYPVNTEAQKTDRCKFMYSGVTSSEHTEPVQQVTIGEKVVKFLLGTRAEGEVTTEKIVASESVEEPTAAPKTMAETTTVTVGGYDVTSQQKTEEPVQQTTQEEPKTFFQKFMRFLFG